MFYLICYDIVCDRRRSRVAKLLKFYGLRVQKSVFECVLDDKQQTQLQTRLLKLLNVRQDQIRFYPISDRSRKKAIVLGLQVEFAVDDAVFVV